MLRKINLAFLFLVIAVLFTCPTFATDYYVATDGNDSNAGTIGTPFATIQKAAGSMSAGDTCYIRAGTYHEEVVIDANYPDGNDTNPITFIAYSSETVTLDGTETITSSWTQHSGSIYKTTLSKDIWQLFVDGEMMTPARWPNAIYDTNDFWDHDLTWGHQEPTSSSNGHMYDLPHNDVNLMDLDFSLVGAMAVLHVGLWRTEASDVNEHAAGSDNFTYTPVQTYSGGKAMGRYFLESKLELLDQAKEWFYDSNSSTLYLWADDSNDPSGRTIKGKTQTYAFEIVDTNGITISDLNFFGVSVDVNDSS